MNVINLNGIEGILNLYILSIINVTRDSSTAIPEECCIRENYRRGSLDDSFPVCVAILTAFSETLSTRNLSLLCEVS